VPHIFAASLPEGAFALGHAQAEDRLEQIYANYRLAAGRMAEVVGRSAVEDDFKQRFAGHETVCRRRYPELPAEVRELCESYQAGVRAYLADHPDKRPANALELEPWMVPATLRLMIFNWPIGRANKELGLRGKFNLFSNQWAVRPERTADGAAILLIDPHVFWDGPFRFYEFRLHAGMTDLSGFGPVGTPMLGLGHNAFLGWAFTTGGPDTTDVYVEQVDRRNPGRYRYDDQWREFTSEHETIAVKGAPDVLRTLERSHHGPIAVREGTKAYAIACPYFEQIDVAAQFYRMMTAKNLAEFDAALAMNHLMEQNVMYADVEGNIRYVSAGRVPIRPKGFDFSKPVPGNTSKSEWLGIHPIKDLVQVLNPAGGYLQNCNISPDSMAVDLPLKRSDYPQHVYNHGTGVTNSRSRRATELLESHHKLTIEEAQAIALDIHADRCEAWQTALRDSAQSVNVNKRRKGVAPVELQKAIDTLLAWNGMMDQDSVGATLYRGLRTVAQDHKLSADGSREALLDALAEALAWLNANYGTSEVKYGQLHRVRRGDHSWPVSGGNSGGGDQTLRAVDAKLEGKVYYGTGGQNWVQLVQFRPGAVRSWSLTPYGQSDDPKSPHYADQAEKLFSPGRMKPTWFQSAELEGNVESTKVLHW
jgi:acyl-homoserine lactone acylase PvdQ